MLRRIKVCFLVFIGLIFPGLQAFGAPTAEAFGELPRIYDAAISPDGTRVAVFINIKGTYGIGILSIDGSGDEPKSVMLGEGVKPAWVKWANDDRVLASLWQSQKFDGTPVTSGAIYTINTASMKGRYLVKPPRGMIRQYNNRVIDFLEDDPDHILMSFSNTDAFAPDVQRVDVATGKSKRLKKGSRRIQNWYTDLRGEPRVGQGINDYNTKEREWTLQIRDVNENKWRSVKNYPGLNEGANIYGFTSDPNELIISLRKGKTPVGSIFIILLKRR